MNKILKRSTQLLLSTLLLASCGSSRDGASRVAPTVLLTAPADADTGVPVNRRIIASFDTQMNPDSLNGSTFTVVQGTAIVAGTVSYSGTSVIFKPTANLATSAPFTATITTGALSASGVALKANSSWSFTTGTTSDSTAPTVTVNSPVDGQSGVPLNRRVSAVFSEVMDPSTFTTSTFTVKQGTVDVAGTVTFVGTTAYFTPSANLQSSVLYTATITTGVKDLASNALAADNTWTFTTGTTTGMGPAPVILGLAGDYAILSKSGISTVPPSAITGNIAVSPIDSTAITGFSLGVDASNVFSVSTQVTGHVFAPDYAAPTPSNLTTAVSNMQTAYVDAAGRATPDYTELGAGDISGRTLSPGLYKWGTSLSINTDITLEGGAEDVWIFQIAGGITQANGARITLAGGALAKNIFWQAFGDVAIGTTAHFEGILLSKTAIALNTGATMNGRLFSQTAVTLKSSTVVQPTP